MLAKIGRLLIVAFFILIAILLSPLFFIIVQVVPIVLIGFGILLLIYYAVKEWMK